MPTQTRTTNTAQNARTPRKTVDVFGSHRHRVETMYLIKAARSEVHALALAHAETFKDAREEREQMLRDADVPPSN
jgi:hypothetical protein